MLIHFGLIPYIVFDGDYLPSKAATEADRSKRRAESKKKGLELYRMNKPSQAHLELQKAVEVTPAMARELIEELKKANVQYVVAPYEADAQLVYLERQGLIQGIISEDSDLLVFGAKRLLTKLDQFGECIEVNRSNFASCSAVSLTDWSDEEFRRMAILSGCDYLASISGMGLKNAYRLVRKYKTIEKILRMLQFDGKFHVAPGYLDAFRKADLTFQYQRVFCPIEKKIVTLTEVQEDLQLGDLDFVGPRIDQSIAAAVATGELDPMTKAPIVRLKQEQDTVTAPSRSMATKQEGTPLTALKANQSLDNFFKSQKRTPLAELDPNQFTPSPSQQQLMRQNTDAVWESPAVTAETPTRSIINIRNVDVASARPNSVDRQHATTSISSVPNAKRRRLLDDITVEVAGKLTRDTHEERSPFFKSEAQPSNSRFKSGSSSKTTKKKEFKIWCEEPTRTMTSNGVEAIDGMTMPDRKQTISSPVATTTAATPAQQDEGHSKGDYSTSRTAQQSCKPTTPPASSLGSIDLYERSDSTATILDRNVTAQLRSLTSKQIFQSNTASRSRSFGEVGRNSTVAIEGGIQINAVTEPNDIGQRNTTPLQRIGAGAVGRSFSYNRPLHHSAKVQLRRSMSSISNSRPDTPCLPLNHSIGPDASREKGSEDFIIPDSDEDLDEEVSEGDRDSQKTIDLGRFVFHA